MDIVLHIVHALSALVLIVLILVQQGKGAEAGASFGAGSSQTMFGSGGAGNFLTRATAVLAAVFMLTSLALAWQARHTADTQGGTGISSLNQAIQESQTQKQTDQTPQQKSANGIPAQVSVPDVNNPDAAKKSKSDIPSVDSSGSADAAKGANNTSAPSTADNSDNAPATDVPSLDTSGNQAGSK